MKKILIILILLIPLNIYAEEINLLTDKLKRTNYDRRIMNWLLNTNIELGEKQGCVLIAYREK